jgi:hypothetical protein
MVNSGAPLAKFSGYVKDADGDGDCALVVSNSQHRLTRWNINISAFFVKDTEVDVKRWSWSSERSCRLKEAQCITCRGSELLCLYTTAPRDDNRKSTIPGARLNTPPHLCQ